MYRPLTSSLDGLFGSFIADKREERTEVRSFVISVPGTQKERTEIRSFQGIAPVGQAGSGLAEGVADGGELRAGLAAEGGQGDDAHHGDEGQEQGVLDERGATIGVAEAGTQVRGDGLEQVHGGLLGFGSPQSRGRL
jgi:hypothetical protein